MLHPQPDNTPDFVERPQLPMRVFEVTYVDGEIRNVSAHGYDTTNGNLVFVDRVPVDEERDRLFYRRTIARGQWREVVEVSGPTESKGVN